MYSGAQANSLYKTWELRVCGLAKTTMLCILVFSDEIFCTIYKLLRYVVIQPNTVNNTVSARRYIFLRNGDCCEEAKKSSTSLVRLLSSGLFNCIIWYCFVLDFIKVISCLRLPVEVLVTLAIGWPSRWRSILLLMVVGTVGVVS